MGLFGSRKSTYAVGKAIKKLPNGQWVVRMGGKKVVTNLITDESIKTGSRIRVTGGNGAAKKRMILGADK